MRHLAIPLVAVAALALSNCNALFAFAPDQICESQVRAICHFAFGCCDATERTVFAAQVAGFRNEGECINELLEEGGGNCQNSFVVQEATQQNRFTYDNALAEKCTKPGLDALNQCQIAALDRAQLVIPEECEDIDGVAFGVGKVAAGNPCFASFECTPVGSVCDPPEDPDPDDNEILVTAVGTCRAPAKDGEDCSSSDDDDEGSDGLCEPGTFCENGDECVALLAVDEDCVVDAQCETEFCNPLDGNQCNELLDDDEDCLEGNDCLSGLCLPNPDGGALICTPQPTLDVQACNGLQGDDTAF